MCAAQSFWLCDLPLECGWLIGAVLLEKPSLLLQLLTIANDFLASDGPSCPDLLFMLGFGPAWPYTGLCILSWPLWVHMCSCPSVSWRHYVSCSCWTLLAFTLFQPPLLQWSLDLGEDSVPYVPVLGWAFCNLLCSEPWTVVSLCVNHHPLQIEASPIRAECCINLKV